MHRHIVRVELEKKKKKEFKNWKGWN